jgi:hypothetical protein
MQIKHSKKTNVRLMRTELQVLVRVESEVDWDVLRSRVAAIIADSAPTTMEVIDDHILFTAGFWRFVPSTNLLIPFHSGEVRIDRRQRTVLYVFSFQRLLWVWMTFCLVATTIPAISLDDPTWLWLNGPLVSMAVLVTLFGNQMKIGELTYRAIRSSLNRGGAAGLDG